MDKELLLHRDHHKLSIDGILSSFKSVSVIASALDKLNGKTCYRVAVMLPAMHGLARKMIIGFTKTMLDIKRKSMKVSIELFNSNNDLQLMRREAELIVESGYDIVVTLGANTTRMMRDVTLLMDSPPPVVFGGFDCPVELGVVDSLSSSGNNFTGVVMGDIPYMDQVQSIAKINPVAKKVVVIFNQDSPVLDKSKQGLINSLRVYDFESVELPLKRSNGIESQVNAFFTNNHKIDLAIILRDSFLLADVKNIIHLCEKNKVFLLTSDWDSVEKGAMAGYGIEEEEMGYEIAKQVYQVIGRHKSPSDLPVVKPHFLYKLKINVGNLEKWGMSGVDIKQILSDEKFVTR